MNVMSRCLNPKKAHENRGVRAPSGGDDGEKPVACQFCKYLLEGAMLGDCRVIRWIGSGAFGDVYEAEQIEPLNRRVAIKVMSLERVLDGESAEMFAREVSTIAALDHPNILPVLRAGVTDDGRSYLVMKFAAQGSLQQFCQSAAPALSFVPTVVPAPGITAETPADVIIMAAETLHVAPQHGRTASGAEEVEGESDRPEQEEEQAASERAEADPVLVETKKEPPGEEAAQEQASNVSPGIETSRGKPVRSPVVSLTGEAQANENDTIKGIDEISARQNDSVETIDEAQTSEDNNVEATEKRSEGEIVTAAGASEGRGGSVEQISGEAEAGLQERVIRAQEADLASTAILAEESTPVTPAAAPLFPQPTEALILSPQQVLRYLEEAAAALHYAHQRGLIHLDVKPANLLLDAHGRLMLADFGVSVLLEGYTHASLHYYVGTPLYTAPEQWLEQPRPASDQYALAVTCYQLLTGRPPFTGNLYSVMHGHLQGSPPPMSEFNPLIPAQIEEVIRRALAKDPEDRYPNVLAFAQAYRDALESAASAETETQMQQRVTYIPEQHTSEKPSQNEAPLVLSMLEAKNDITDVGPEESIQPGAFNGHKPEKKVPGALLHAGIRLWLRSLLLLLLALLLVMGGSLGVVRAERPCWLGICPRISLSTNILSFTNDESQKIKIVNTGTADLHWQASTTPSYTWLSVYPGNGTLVPGQTSYLAISTNVDSLNRSGVYPDTVDINGGPGVLEQRILVMENVVKGLEAVSVKRTGETFLYEQGHLQPMKQTVTITNNSGHLLNWFTQYTDNNWLSVTPSQGNLANNQSVELMATVANPQDLANDTYQVIFSLVGKLDNQSDFQLLATINFTLQVNQVVPITPTIAQPNPSALSFTAQPVVAPGAPGLARSNHSMVWDSQDDQLLIFGGIDSQGNLLNDLWAYRPASNSWTNLTPLNPAAASDCSSSSPAPRMNAAMVWDSVDQEVLLYGGEGNDGSYLGDLWAYSPAKGSWTALACSGNGPGARGGAGVAWNGSQMFILDGLGASGPLSDFWAYSPAAGWSRIAPTTPLGARAYPAMSWNSKDGRLYVFGGLKGNAQQGDFYAYAPGSGWSAITPGNGSAPLARQQAMSAWDSANNVFLLMGGYETNNDTTYSAMWAYAPAQNAWWQITSLQNSSSTSVIPSRMASVMIWDSTDNRAYVYAGSGGGNKTAFSDLWMITPK